MDNLSSILGIILALVTIIALVVLVFELFIKSNRPKKIPRNLMMRIDDTQEGASMDSVAVEALGKEMQRERKAKEVAQADELEKQFFQAGYFSQLDKKNYYAQKKKMPFIFGGGLLLMGLLVQLPIIMTLVLVLIGAYYAYKLPDFRIVRAIEKRQEDIMFFLPLVVEQISIGVSSSLDVGPCISKIVEMADERDSHNAVTELLKFAESYIRSGSSFEEAMSDVAAMSGSTEVKHVFLSLANVSKHGGEITKQLQELGDTAYAKRENQVEARIAKLQLKSSLPVSIVFIGFMLILLSGIGSSLLKGLSEAGL